MNERFRGFPNVVTLQGANFTICHAAHIRCNFQLTKERALAAALGCAKRHAFLRASFSPIPKTTFTKPIFAPLEGFTPALDMVTPDKTWEQVLHDELLEPDRPLFRWKIIASSPGSDEWHILLFSSHAVSDGFSGMIILNDFFTNLSNPTSLDEIPLGEKTYRCLDLFGKKTSWMTEMKEWIDSIKFRYLILPKPKIFLPLPILPEPSLCFSIGRELTKAKLTSLCKAKGLTLHGPLTACLALVLYPYYQAKLQRGDGQMDFEICMAYNLRDRFPDPSAKGQVGTFIGTNYACWSQNMQSTFWDLARNAKHATDEATDLDEMYKTDASFDKISDMKYYLSARPDGALGTAIYSNVGRYPYTLDHASAKIGETLTIDTLHVVNAAIPIGYQICFYTTGTRKLCYSVQSRFDKVETTKIFDQWVELCEKCHEFGDEPAISHLPTPSVNLA